LGEYYNLNKLFVGGQWIDGSGDEIKVFNPFTQKPIISFKGGKEKEVNDAFEAAKKSSEKWANMSPGDKREILDKAMHLLDTRREEIINWLIIESGSTKLKANLELDMARTTLAESASIPGRLTGYIPPSDKPGRESFVYRIPLGVVTVISPWNYPFHLSLRSVAPALATGNAVILKPATETPITGGTLIAKIFEEAGLPAGVLNIVVGKSRDVGDIVVKHPISKFVSFTGSIGVGRHVASLAGEGLKKVGLELGGNGAMVVFQDADLDMAVNAATFGKYLHQGQECIAINRILVHNVIYDRFAQAFLETSRQLKVGDPSDPKVTIGPIINQKQLDRMLKLLEDTEKAGGKVLLRGEVNGLLLGPTVLTEVTNDMPLAQEEIFGPIAVLIRFNTEEEALKIVNGVPQGLSSSVYTRDTAKGIEFAKRVDHGMIHVNDQPINDEPYAAFGGLKQSGVGRFGTQSIVEELTTSKWITVQKKPSKYPLTAD
jgi:aldehyde dehydrogenase (NAD+)